MSNYDEELDAAVAEKLLDIQVGTQEKKSHRRWIASLLAGIGIGMASIGLVAWMMNPEPVEDTVVVTPPVEEKIDTGKRVVTLGDSTVSMGDGHERGQSRSNCPVEHGTWSTLLEGSVEEWSCTGATAMNMRDKIHGEQHSPDVDTVYVTVGSNDFRLGGNHLTLMSGLESLRTEMSQSWPEADIVWVGYLPVPDSGNCYTEDEKEYANYLNLRHVKADNAMREVSTIHGDAFVDVSDVEYDMCSPGTLVRAPGADLGMEWHTTKEGHRHVYGKIVETLKNDDVNDPVVDDEGMNADEVVIPSL